MIVGSAPVYTIGRYTLFGEIASGGMATVHYGRLRGSVGFARTVAVKRLHPHLAKEPDFIAMFVDEARLVSRIQHPNVVQTLDVVTTEGEVLIVMELIQGESLSRLLRLTRNKGLNIPPDVVSAIMVHVLEGLHAAHDASDEHGQNLQIVHRDVSPQNVLVGVDGSARVLDFGVARAMGRLQTTEEGKIKGKFGYLSPEQLIGSPLDRRSDVFAAAVVLWESLVGGRLFKHENPANMVYALLNEEIAAPSSRLPGLPPELDAVVLKGLAREPDLRYRTARDMALALEKALPPATTRRVSEWIQEVAGDELAARSRQLAKVELDPSGPTTGADLTPATGSGISALTSMTAEQTPPPSNRRLLWAVAAVATIAGGSVAALVLSNSSATGPPAPASEAVEVTHTAVVEEATPVELPPVDPSGSAQAGVAASASASASAKAAAPPRRHRPTAGSKRPPPPPAKVDCSNPFIVDANGTKKPRPECF
jgi:serine/threonine-protein kinase